MDDTATGFFGRLVDKTRTALRGVAARHALRQELLECDRSGTLDVILADLNMSRSELKPLISNYPLSSRLFGAMAERLGVDPAQDGPVVKRELQRTCALCAHQSECQHWLDSGRSEGYEKFCPNTDYWHELKERITAAVLRPVNTRCNGWLGKRRPGDRCGRRHGMQGQLRSVPGERGAYSATRRL